MTAAEYLESRGWVVGDTADDGTPIEWVDPHKQSVVPAAGGGNLLVTVGTYEAITVQRGRDEEAARAAWVAFAAAVSTDPHATVEGAASRADRLLNEYRARHCPEVES